MKAESTGQLDPLLALNGSRTTWSSSSISPYPRRAQRAQVGRTMGFSLNLSGCSHTIWLQRVRQSRCRSDRTGPWGIPLSPDTIMMMDGRASSGADPIDQPPSDTGAPRRGLVSRCARLGTELINQALGDTRSPPTQSRFTVRQIRRRIDRAGTWGYGCSRHDPV